MAQATEEPQRIGGWLLLITLGLVISPARIGVMLAQNHLPMFSNGTWQALTTQASEFYHPLWAPLIWFEIAGNLLIVALALTTLCFLLMKSKHTPKLVISWLVLGLAFVTADFFLAGQFRLSQISQPIRNLSKSWLDQLLAPPFGFPASWSPSG